MAGTTWHSAMLLPLLALPAFYGTFFMLVPTLPLVFVSPRWFRRIVDHVVAFFTTYVVAVCDLFYGIRIIVSGDKLTPGSGNNVLIMNHRTRMDWLFLWSALWRYSYHNLARQKITLKYPIKFWPIIGACGQFIGYLFLKKRLLDDKSYIRSMLNHFQQFKKHFDVLFFPEGTDLCDIARTVSEEFARRNGLPDYRYVVHPRVHGFSYLTGTMMDECKLDSVYDITVAYSPVSKVPQTELDIACGCIPEEVHFKIKRYPASELPRDEEGLQEFCRERFREKEETLRKFYTEDGRFCDDSLSSSDSRTARKTWLMLALVYWLPMTFIALYNILTNYYCFMYIIVVSLILSYFNWIYGGLDRYYAPVNGLKVE